MKKILLHQTLFPLVVLAMTLDLSNVSMTHQVSCCENQSNLTVSFEMNEVEPRLCPSNTVLKYWTMNLCIQLHYREQRLTRWACSCDWCVMSWLGECCLQQCRVGKVVYVLPRHSHVSASILLLKYFREQNETFSDCWCQELFYDCHLATLSSYFLRNLVVILS